MVTVVGNTRWGYCFTPKKFETKNKALSYAREMVRDGYWFAYRIINNG